MKMSGVGAEEVRAAQMVEKGRMKPTFGHVLAALLVLGVVLWLGLFWVARWILHLLH